MLKWTVIARRDVDSKPATTRHSTASILTTPTSRTKPKRRHSSTAATQRRRTSNRNSLGLEMDKENQFTSTPIKFDTDHLSFDALRDVSNLTPTNSNQQRRPIKKPANTPSSHRKVKKKKKDCLNPYLHDNEKKSNYFRPFETVDSHIKGVLEDEEICECKSKPKRRIQEAFAPTLPTFGIEYSPCFIDNIKCAPSMETPLGKFFANPQTDLHPNKKAKVDQVSDFLHQITFVTSPEDDKKFPPMESKSNNIIKVSPLVKKFVDLRFSQISYANKTNDSTMIDDLSLDKIVDAILDSSGEKSIDLTRENDLNETHEDNLINLENELQIKKCCSSTDSGFKSTTTEISHQLEGNFRCKCSKNSFDIEDKTVINTNETYNERCVDELPKTRKRPLQDNLELNSNDFMLKRQRCIRRRPKQAKPSSPVPTEANLEESFDPSIISGKIDDDKKSTPLETNLNETFLMLPETPIEGNRRFRRCLLFESPTTLSESGSSANGSSTVGEVKGSMDLHIYVKDEELFVNVIRCKDLAKLSGKQINAYVKVALSDRLGKRSGILQRTAVQANSSKPVFKTTFQFPLDHNRTEKRCHIEVWHRDRSSRTSEFLGSMSFDVKDVCEKDIIGSYRLLPQSTGRGQNVPITLDNNSFHHQLCKETEIGNQPSSIMCESHSSVEEMMSLEDVDLDLKKSINKTVLSEQQKYADENLFLRYLELDPVEGPDAIPAALQRKATGNKNGRTPFTQTKKLTRPPKSGFGFSVVWTHPPRIERVEKGLPADKAGILPGDYLIFVDKHNVVMMPEIDILNLIRSYGSQLTLEIFRRNASRNGSVPSVKRLNSTGTCSTTGLVPITSTSTITLTSPAANLMQQQRRPSTVCSTNATSIDYNRRKLHLPQVTFSAEKTTSNSQEENRKKIMYQLIHKEQQYATGLQFAITRFVSALAERTDLITPSEHKILFQNVEEILQITEDIIDNLIQDNDGDPQLHIILHTYYSKLNELTTAYKRYCSGIKKADCVLVNKTRNTNSEFTRFLQIPSIPKRRPDITTFIHKPLEHYREILKLLSVIQTYTKSNHEDYAVINEIVNDLQSTYREITTKAGLMEPIGEGRPLLTVQDLENRLVFTKCKPFVLNKPGRQWIFGGDLGRVEGRNIRQYWTLLFSDLLLFAKVSRDRVLFIIEDPLPLTHITDMFFNVRKKDTEFRITINPDGCHATSPTVHCGPDLTRTPKKNANKRTIILRAPTTELKAVWQNLLQRQIFHVNAGMDGSSFSSPLESPDAPITSSVVTLQSAESLSFRRQTPQNLNEHSIEMQKQIDALIEHKCKQLSKTNSVKGNAIHLEKWMKGQLDEQYADEIELEPLSEEWTEEMLRKRSEELQLIDAQGNITCRQIDNVAANNNIDNTRHNETSAASSSKFDELNLSDHDQSPSKSTTTESQVTVRSSPLVPESVPVCRQCHKNCIQSTNNINLNNKINENSTGLKDVNDNREDDGDWRPLLLMGLSAINPAASLVKLDPFSAPVPQINVAPPTPSESSIRTNCSDQKNVSQIKSTCNCQNSKPTNLDLFAEVDASPDDSPQTEEHPYHSLSSSNLTLRRFGTVSSLERLGDDIDERLSDDHNSSESDKDHHEDNGIGIDNEAFYHSSIRNWTAKAGSFVAEKMAFFGGLGEDYRSGGSFFDRYLKTENTLNGDDLQEDETSGATSGEEIWGTPTSGGELDDPLSSPNYEGKNSPYDGSISSDNGDDTELMMDELLMTPPISGAIMRGLLPRRTLEPLIEEDCSESCSPTSSATPTEPSVSPEQGNGTGDVADICSTAVVENAKNILTANQNQTSETPPATTSAAAMTAMSFVPKIHRSESYRRIVEAADERIDRMEAEVDTLGFFNRFKPTVKFINIERVPRARSVKIFEFFNVRRERRIHQTIPEDKQLIKMFSKEGTISDTVPTSYSEKPMSPRRLKDKQLDRRFWKQLSKRRGNKMTTFPA